MLLCYDESLMLTLLAWPSCAVVRRNCRIECDENAVAWDLEFRAMEVYNSAWVRTFQTDLFSALVLYQANDLELEETADTMRGMTRSLGYYYE